VSLEAVDRANGNDATQVDVRVDLGATGTFFASLPLPVGSAVQLSDYFGTAEHKTRRALRGLYLQGWLEHSEQRVRLVRLPTGDFGLVVLDGISSALTEFVPQAYQRK
jgi:hypothetical protein